MTSPPARLPPKIRFAAMLVAAVGLVYATYRMTLEWSAGELLEARARLQSLEIEVRALGGRLKSEQTGRAQAERQAEVTNHANRLLREEESARLAELERLQGELDFYRRLAGTSGMQTGLSVYHLELQPTASQRVFRFELTLTQNLRRSAITTGDVGIALEGTRENRPVTLRWQQITENDPPVPTFRFKYFEQLTGYLALPAEFAPLRVVVTLEAKGQSKPVVRSFDWAQLAAPDRDAPPPEPGEKTSARPAGVPATDGFVDFRPSRHHVVMHSGSN